MPMWFLTATEVPAEWPSTEETKQGSIAMDHLAFLAVCSAWSSKCPSGIFSSCPTTMSALVLPIYAATTLPQLGFTVSTAQYPAYLCEKSSKEMDWSPGQSQALSLGGPLDTSGLFPFLHGCCGQVAGLISSKKLSWWRWT